jgi:glyoxylase-like metal-dependent hydrolase (beta-lactamase superfamily II)
VVYFEEAKTKIIFMNLYTINTGFFKLDGGAMFGVVPKSIWNKLNPADDNNLCTWAMRCLLIEEGNKLILIDNGIGDKQDAKFLSHYHLHGDDTLDKSLAAHGFSKDDITDVFLTHLHFDHCGGSIKREGDKLVPAFKNATFWSNTHHWNWATHANNITYHPSDITDNLSLITVHGHTDAMMLPVINYKGKTIVYMADLLPSVAHIPLPYVMGYDMFPLTTLHEKKTILSEAMNKDYILYFEHDPKNECCTLQQTEKGIRQKDTFKLSAL